MAIGRDSHFSIDGSLSIDRLTLLFFTPNLSLWNDGSSMVTVNQFSNYIEKVFLDDLDPDFPQGSPTELFCRHYRTLSGFDIQFGTKMPRRKKIKDSDYILLFGTQSDKDQGFMWQNLPNEYALRVEFNPNKSDSITKLSPLFCDFKNKNQASLVRVARIDVAIDYPVEINPALVLCDCIRKSFIACGKDGLESLYFGTRSSDNYFRIYNKRIELLENDQIDVGHPLWRVELESKKSFFLCENPDLLKSFQRLRFFDGCVRSGDWVVDLILQQASVYGLQTVLRSMPITTQKRYRKFFKDSDLSDQLVSPSFIYSRDFLDCWNKLRTQILFSLGFDLVDCIEYGRN